MKIITALASIGLLAAPATAAELLVQGGKLHGANGVDVDGILYDVRFVEGTCSSVFDGCDEASDFTFNDGQNQPAIHALFALLDQVFVDGPQGNFDSDSSLTFGCASTYCIASIPIRLENGYVFTYGALNESGNRQDFGNPTYFDRFDNHSDRDILVWAKFSASSDAVPEPASWAMMIAGLGMIGTTARRRMVSKIRFT